MRHFTLIFSILLTLLLVIVRAAPISSEDRPITAIPDVQQDTGYSDANGILDNEKYKYVEDDDSSSDT
jgi:hypothetical protein